MARNMARYDGITIPEPTDRWHGGLDEGQLTALASIAEAGPDVYSIVKRAWSQGHDPDTIKQMLVSLQYPTSDVDRIVSELEAGKASDGNQPKPGDAKPQGKSAKATGKTIYVDKTGKASYDKPKASGKTGARVDTGNQFVDELLNNALQSGGKEKALKLAVKALTSYAEIGTRDASGSRGGGRYRRADDRGILKSLRDIDTFLKQARLMKK